MIRSNKTNNIIHSDDYLYTDENQLARYLHKRRATQSGLLYDESRKFTSKNIRPAEPGKAIIGDGLVYASTRIPPGTPEVTGRRDSDVVFSNWIKLSDQMSGSTVKNISNVAFVFKEPPVAGDQLVFSWIDQYGSSYSLTIEFSNGDHDLVIQNYPNYLIKKDITTLNFTLTSNGYYDFSLAEMLNNLDLTYFALGGFSPSSIGPGSGVNTDIDANYLYIPANSGTGSGYPTAIPSIAYRSGLFTDKEDPDFGINNITVEDKVSFGVVIGGVQEEETFAGQIHTLLGQVENGLFNRLYIEFDTNNNAEIKLDLDQLTKQDDSTTINTGIIVPNDDFYLLVARFTGNTDTATSMNWELSLYNRDGTQLQTNTTTLKPAGTLPISDNFYNIPTSIMGSEQFNGTDYISNNDQQDGIIQYDLRVSNYYPNYIQDALDFKISDEFITNVLAHYPLENDVFDLISQDLNMNLYNQTSLTFTQSKEVPYSYINEVGHSIKNTIELSKATREPDRNGKKVYQVNQIEIIANVLASPTFPFSAQENATFIDNWLVFYFNTKLDYNFLESFYQYGRSNIYIQYAYASPRNQRFYSRSFFFRDTSLYDAFLERLTEKVNYNLSPEIDYFKRLLNEIHWPNLRSFIRYYMRTAGISYSDTDPSHSNSSNSIVGNYDLNIKYGVTDQHLFDSLDEALKSETNNEPGSAVLYYELQLKDGIDYNGEMRISELLTRYKIVKLDDKGTQGKPDDMTQDLYNDIINNTPHPMYYNTLELKVEKLLTTNIKDKSKNSRPPLYFQQYNKLLSNFTFSLFVGNFQDDSKFFAIKELIIDSPYKYNMRHDGLDTNGNPPNFIGRTPYNAQLKNAPAYEADGFTSIQPTFDTNYLSGWQFHSHEGNATGIVVDDVSYNTIFLGSGDVYGLRISKNGEVVEIPFDEGVDGVTFDANGMPMIKDSKGRDWWITSPADSTGGYSSSDWKSQSKYFYKDARRGTVPIGREVDFNPNNAPIYIDQQLHIVGNSLPNNYYVRTTNNHPNLYDGERDIAIFTDDPQDIQYNQRVRR